MDYMDPGPVGGRAGPRACPVPPRPRWSVGLGGQRGLEDILVRLVHVLDAHLQPVRGFARSTRPVPSIRWAKACTVFTAESKVALDLAVGAGRREGSEGATTRRRYRCRSGPPCARRPCHLLSAGCPNPTVSNWSPGHVASFVDQRTGYSPGRVCGCSMTWPGVTHPTPAACLPPRGAWQAVGVERVHRRTGPARGGSARRPPARPGPGGRAGAVGVHRRAARGRRRHRRRARRGARPRARTGPTWSTTSSA